ASASPRRAALLKQAGIVPARIIAPEVDETPHKGELPRVYALRLAVAKAEAVVRMLTHPPLEGGSKSSARLCEPMISGRGEVETGPLPEILNPAENAGSTISTLPQGEGRAVVLAADTAVALGRRILPKAESP